MDSGVLSKPKIDAYIKTEFKKKKLKTKVETCVKGGKVDWN